MKEARNFKIIAVDFDGTVVTHDFPHIGQDIGATPVLKRLVYEAGHKLILNTMRSGKQLSAAVEWFEERDIPLYGVQYEPNQVKWTSSNKCYADLYIDDAALGAPLIEPKNGRPHIDWPTVELILEKMNFLPQSPSPRAPYITPEWLQK